MGKVSSCNISLHASICMPQIKPQIFFEIGKIKIHNNDMPTKINHEFDKICTVLCKTNEIVIFSLSHSDSMIVICSLQLW